MSKCFLGEPPVNIKTWFIEHYAPAQVGHAETWIKFSENDTWHEYDIEGALDMQALFALDLAVPYGPMIKWTPPPYAVEIGTDVTSIGQYAFSRCSELTSVTIPDGVTSIGGGAFYGCSELTSVMIPNSVTSIWGGAFYGCSSLMSVTFLGKTLEQVQNIEDGNGNKYYPWSISDTSIINVA